MKSLYVDDGRTAERALTTELMCVEYDCIMVGASLRVVPPYFSIFTQTGTPAGCVRLLFEKLINVIHLHVPASTKVCFNTNPSDTADTVLRWV